MTNTLTLLKQEKRPREAEPLVLGHSYLDSRFPTISIILCTAELTFQGSWYRKFKCRDRMKARSSSPSIDPTVTRCPELCHMGHRKKRRQGPFLGKFTVWSGTTTKTETAMD